MRFKNLLAKKVCFKDLSVKLGILIFLTMEDMSRVIYSYFYQRIIRTLLRHESLQRVSITLNCTYLADLNETGSITALVAVRV